MSSALAAIMSVNAHSFLVCSPDNRIRLWDVDTKKETRSYVEKKHLSHSYTCWTWSQVAGNRLGLCAAGTSDGMIIIWDLSRGVVVHEIASSGDLPPTDVSFSKDAKSLYVASGINKIDVYDVASGAAGKSLKCGKKAVQRICVNPKADVLAIGR